jgi:hypothetical protein
MPGRRHLRRVLCASRSTILLAARETALHDGQGRLVSMGWMVANNFYDFKFRSEQLRLRQSTTPIKSARKISGATTQEEITGCPHSMPILKY